MNDPQATLLLTRPEAQSRAFLAACERDVGHSVPAVISPLLRIEPVGDLPELEAFDTIVVTSGNSVARLGSALSGCRVVTVGERTAALARDQGADAKALGEDVETFLADLPALGRVLFCRGVHTRGDLAARLAAQGHVVEEAVIYDQVAQPLTEPARRLLEHDAPIVAPVFSPRTAALLTAETDASRLTVLAISQATADVFGEEVAVRIADHPTAAAMRQLVIATI